MHALSCCFVRCCVIRVSNRLIDINYHLIFSSQLRISMLVLRPYIHVILEERLGRQVSCLLIWQYGGLMIDTAFCIYLFEFVAAESNQ